MVKGRTGCGLRGYSLVSVLFNRPIQYSCLFLNNISLVLKKIYIYIYIYMGLQDSPRIVNLLCVYLCELAL